MTGEWCVRLGAISGAMSVAMGAFGAHGLRRRVIAGALEPRMLEVFQTGAQYQMYHSLALVGVGLLLLSGRTSTALDAAAASFLAGIVLFSGSLYALALTRISVLGAITPLGGIAFLIGWLALAIGAGQAAKPAL